MFPVPQAPATAGEGKLAALAAELATKLLPLPDILKRYEMSADELKGLMKDPQFRHMVSDFRREWHNPMSARERVKVKASLAVEDGILELHRMFYDPDIMPAQRLDAYKQLVQLADMGPKREAEGPTGGGFSISINIPPPGDGEAPRTVTLEHNEADEVKDAEL